MGCNIWDIKLNKNIFYGANAVFWLLGWGSLGIGIWLYVEKNAYAYLAPASYSSMSAAGLCISIGLMVIIVAVVGCIGVWKRGKCYLISYGCVVLLLIGIQLLTGVMGTFYDNSMKHRVKYALYATMNRTHTDKNYPVNYIANTWDDMQAGLHCCGVEGYQDWFFSSRWRKNEFVPDSCCDAGHFSDDDAMLNCGKNTHNKERWFQQGCEHPFTDWLLQHITIIKFFTISFLLVEVVLMILMIRIYRHMTSTNKDRYTVEYRQSSQNQEGNLNLLQ